MNKFTFFVSARYQLNATVNGQWFCRSRSFIIIIVIITNTWVTILTVDQAAMLLFVCYVSAKKAIILIH